MKRIVCLMMCFAMFTGYAAAMGNRPGHGPGEHPEHPEGSEKGHTKKETLVTSQKTLDAVAQYIRDYVKDEEPKGKVRIEDPETGDTLELKLDKVHRKRLAKIAPGKYFVCADFKSEKGTIYDLDFFVRKKGKDKFELVEGKTSLHKVAGKARYNWFYDKKDGVWKKKPAGEKMREHPEKTKERGKETGEHPEGADEHPEHPN